jgi:hypothetical protein
MNLKSILDAERYSDLGWPIGSEFVCCRRSMLRGACTNPGRSLRPTTRRAKTLRGGHQVALVSLHLVFYRGA